MRGLGNLLQYVWIRRKQQNVGQLNEESFIVKWGIMFTPHYDTEFSKITAQFTFTHTKIYLNVLKSLMISLII